MSSHLNCIWNGTQTVKGTNCNAKHVTEIEIQTSRCIRLETKL